MGRLCGLTRLVVVLSAIGCGQSRGTVEAKPAIVREATGLNVGSAPVNSAGGLVTGKINVGGLYLPAGSRKRLVHGRRHVFEVTAHIEKVAKYFTPRLEPGALTRLGTGVVFRNAQVKGSKDSMVKLNVSVLPTTDGDTRIEITERPTIQVTERDSRELRGEVDAHLRTLD